MNRFALARGGLDLFGFDIDCLSDFVEATLLQASVARDMGGDLEFLPVGVGIDAGVETRCGSARTECEARPRGKNAPRASAHPRPDQLTREVGRGCEECSNGDDPPQSGRHR